MREQEFRMWHVEAQGSGTPWETSRDGRGGEDMQVDPLKASVLSGGSNY